MIVTRHVKDNRILLNPEIQLPDGMQVEIIIPDTVAPQTEKEIPHVKPLALVGRWKGIRLSKEEIDEARRECWKRHSTSAN